VEALGGRRAAVIVMIWTHGDKIVGRVTPVLGDGSSPALGQAYQSKERICRAVCAFIDEFAAMDADAPGA
jgi:hypothetical protein